MARTEGPLKVKKSTPREMNLKPREIASNNSTTIAIPSEISASLPALDEKVKSMMEKGQKMIPNGKQADGTPRQAKSCICKVCGKEGLFLSIRDHMERNHLDGICIPCGICDKTFSSRNTLSQHSSTIITVAKYLYLSTFVSQKGMLLYVLIVIWL